MHTTHVPVCRAAKEQLGDQAILNFLPNGELNPNRGKTLRR
jgi:hypothetical protein